MKAELFALTCALLASSAASKKLALNGSPQRQPLARDSNEAASQQLPETVGVLRLKDKDEEEVVEWCQGNVFPSPDETFTVGLSTRPQVFDDSTLTALRTVLNNTPAWDYDRVWEFKAKVTSGFDKTLQFGMAGGSGFLLFNVSANAGSEEVGIKGAVKTVAQYVSVVYRGDPEDLITHKATFSKVCLRQPPCGTFAGCLPEGKYIPNASLNGDSLDACCTPQYCTDAVTCDPSTKYEEYEDADTRLGNTLELCCKPKVCSDKISEICTGSAKPLPGSGILGSTASECCELAYCRDFTGCDPTHDSSQLPLNNDDGTPRIGASEEECCNVIACDAFNCSKSDLWTSKENASGQTGHSFEQCCDPMYCANYTCNMTTKYVTSESPPVQGNSDERCCEPLHCSDYNCSNTSLMLMSGADTRLGSTDAECCEPAVCMLYNCSDPTKYRKKPHYSESGGLQQPRMGGDDEACCTPMYCRRFECSSTKWQSREWEDNDTTLGWTHEQCCDSIYCQNYTCTTDYDGDGNGTKWFKRADTNALRWQGSTDEECCYPLYCSQYETEYPTKWKRKSSEARLLGSTEHECYDPIMCINFCGCNESLGTKIIVDANGVQGSSVDECCENITTSS